MLSKGELKKFNTKNIYESINIVMQHWNTEYGTISIQEEMESIILELTTGGWSENEKFIDELSETMFWVLWWQESKRGGYYKFIIYKNAIFISENEIINKKGYKNVKDI